MKPEENVPQQRSQVSDELAADIDPVEELLTILSNLERLYVGGFEGLSSEQCELLKANIRRKCLPALDETFHEVAKLGS
ncbi:MAG: hypothetical protein RIC14_07825 [Filomicrobium sp.]